MTMEEAEIIDDDEDEEVAVDVVDDVDDLDSAFRWGWIHIGPMACAGGLDKVEFVELVELLEFFEPW